MAKRDQDDHPIFHLENGVPVFDDQRINELERKQEETEQRDRDYKDNQAKVNTRMMIFTGVLAGCSVLAGCVTVWQACIANSTLTEIRNNKSDTQKIVTSAETQATAATKNATAADKFSSSAASIDANIGQAKEDFQRMAEASEKSLRAVSQTDQRAWVGITEDGIQGINPVKDMADMFSSVAKYGYVAMPYTFRIRNVGKTPARYVAMGSTYSVGTEPMQPDLQQAEHRHGTLFPNSSGTVYGHSPITLNKDQFGAWEFKANYVFVYIYIEYYDIFPDTKMHHTWSCTKIDSFGTETFCHTWNDAD